MANSIIGAHGSIGAVLCTPISEPSQPHWKTITITPYAAPIDSRFMTTAFSGTRTERNTASSSRKLSSSTAPMNTGRREDISSAKSTLPAVGPPTWASAPLAGIRSSRTWRTRSSVRASCGLVVGVTTRAAA